MKKLRSTRVLHEKYDLRLGIFSLVSVVNKDRKSTFLIVENIRIPLYILYIFGLTNYLF